MTRWRSTHENKETHTLWLDGDPVGFILDRQLAKLIAERLNCFPCVELPPDQRDHCDNPEPIGPMELFGVTDMHRGRASEPDDPSDASRYGGSTVPCTQPPSVADWCKGSTLQPASKPLDGLELLRPKPDTCRHDGFSHTKNLECPRPQPPSEAEKLSDDEDPLQGDMWGDVL